MQKRLGLFVAALFVTAAVYATSSDTSGSYLPTQGAYGTVHGTVIQQSDDGYNSKPINSANPLPVTGTVTTASSPATASCKTVAVNSQGASNADITVDATAGGVAVLAASTTRCSAVIANVSANDMRCAPTTVTVTSTAGFLVQAGAKLSLGLEGQQAFKCIRTGGSSATASVMESTP